MVVGSRLKTNDRHSGPAPQGAHPGMTAVKYSFISRPGNKLIAMERFAGSTVLSSKKT